MQDGGVHRDEEESDAWSTMYHDLKLTGDDAWEFFELINQRFGTRFDDFRFAEYFPDEGEALTDGIERLLGFAEPRKPLTVHHLSEVVRRGQWFMPETDLSIDG